MSQESRRSFLKQVAIGSLALGQVSQAVARPGGHDLPAGGADARDADAYRGIYRGNTLTRVGFPIGGIGAGMFCLEGTGSLSAFSINHHPDLHNEPPLFAAIHVKGVPNGTKVLEGPVPDHKKFGMPFSGSGGFLGNVWGLPRFREVSFQARFPFATVNLRDQDIPIAVSLTGWSPFVPGDDESASLPAGTLEYTFTNPDTEERECVFSFNTRQWLRNEGDSDRITAMADGFVLHATTPDDEQELPRSLAVFTDDAQTVVDACWFRGNWFDPLTMIWKKLEGGEVYRQQAVDQGAPGASLFVPFRLPAGGTKTIRLSLAWYVPHSKLQSGVFTEAWTTSVAADPAHKYYRPWYTSRFPSLESLVAHWRQHADALRDGSKRFSDALYRSTLPPVIMEAVTANLSILKSPTTMRQQDGRLWLWEGSGDKEGYARGSCTHVWNYAQAIAHLFPRLERTLRTTEFHENQDAQGKQGFRANLPISPIVHDYHPAADGQLGGILKVYRDWRISGDGDWLRDLFPKVKASLDFCIEAWDPGHLGVILEPHHNTYDIEFWGGDGMCTSVYAAALQAFIRIADFLQVPHAHYVTLFEKAQRYMQEKLFNGSYYEQRVQWEGLRSPGPLQVTSVFGEYSPEAKELIAGAGPNYQYGTGCLSDGVIGSWFGQVCGLGEVLHGPSVKMHLQSVFTHNFKPDLSGHVNLQRPTYAVGHEGGLVLCTWPHGGEPVLPLIYCNEVWSGIEYQVASHLLFMGEVDEALTIITACRKRYDGSVRNPFNEYEYGNWYGRALASYSLLQAATGVRYDAVDRTLFVDSRIGDFTCFIATAGGFGTVMLEGDAITVTVSGGEIAVNRLVISGEESTRFRVTKDAT